MSEMPVAESRRIAREKKTIRAMIAIYCRGNHSAVDEENLCAACAALLDYAFARLDRCPFGADKPPCAKCAIHCYKPSLREKVKEVMRYAGPRMLWKHPLLALRHCLDGHRGGNGDALTCRKGVSNPERKNEERS